ncbi:GAF domain-containing protein, partial [Candidatus Amarobacter glycogenicus]|uniref:GAF domain-containing protein n=1 Tax=Candidatus Amarobacter glycogenicus TaxID=3140699 RepID=UPI0031CC90B3
RSQTPLINHFALVDMPSLQQMAQSRQPLVIPDISADPDWVRADASPHVRSWAGIPIAVQQEVVALSGA